jgi:sarcosine oxidase subunit alpha
VRGPPSHAWAAANNASFEDAGSWKRARCFPKQGETQKVAVNRECREVRRGVGILDASTLGKIEVVGPDAAAFLDLIYAGNIRSLPPGRCRYGLLLSENGFVLDDGVVARLTSDRFHLTTTSAGAARVLHHMEDYRQTEYAKLRVWLTSVTEHWGVIAVQGPQAHALIAPQFKSLDLDSLPHMGLSIGRVGNIPVRLFRVSFTGEQGYEIDVPAGFLPDIWEKLINAGATPYGTDAMHVLRAEMGFIIVGQETDGTVTADDLGLSNLVSKSKRDFVGKRSLTLPDLNRRGRRQLVGLLTMNPRQILEEGAQVVPEPMPRIPGTSLGHVTSAYWSETLQRSIALALITDGRSRFGSTLYVASNGGSTAVTVASKVFYDGSRVSPS